MQFTIDIQDEWLSTLDNLASQVLAAPTSSPESALQFAIFEQVRMQRSKPEIMRCWYCDGVMHPRMFRTCFGEVREFYECDKCRFDLDKSFIEAYGAGRPTAA